jgi:hypothetical protein
MGPRVRRNDAASATPSLPVHEPAVTVALGRGGGVGNLYAVIGGMLWGCDCARGECNDDGQSNRGLREHGSLLVELVTPSWCARTLLEWTLGVNQLEVLRSLPLNNARDTKNSIPVIHLRAW